jgi:hypothetical protein
MDYVGGVMASIIASSDLNSGFEPWLSQTKYYKIGIICLFAKHAALRSKSKDMLLWNLRIMCAKGVICLLTDCCFGV